MTQEGQKGQKPLLQREGYVLSFILCLLAFIEGILFTFFCFELLQEQFEAIELNQTYVDDMKELFGRPLSLSDNLTMAFGHDWTWWLIPTTPVLSLNFFERMYTLKDIKKLKDYPEEDYDEDRKLMATAFITSRREKRRLYFLLATFVILWVFYLRYWALDVASGKVTLETVYNSVASLLSK